MSIDFDLFNDGGNLHHYVYTVHNGLSPSATLTDFTIYFPFLSTPQNFDYTLNSTMEPAGWTPTLVQPSAINLGAFVDWVGALAPGASLGGFRVDFTYTGTQPLGSQDFEVYDANFALIDAGRTVPAQHGVPDSLSTGVSILAALIGFGALRRFGARN